MRWLIATSLRLRVLVVAAAAVLVVWGSRVALESPLDVFPEFARPKVEVQTEVPGLSAAEVEALVTGPIESTLNGTPWLETIRSKSVLGLSSVELLFEDGTDLLRARQLVQERLAAELRGMPAVARAPVVLQPLSSTSRALKIGMRSATLSRLELTDLARWRIRPRLLAIRGVANVAIWGARDRQLQVLVDPDRLRAHALTLGDVERAAAAATVLDSGGFVDTPNQRLAIAHRGAVQSAADLANAVVGFVKSTPLRLGDVADVVEGAGPPIGDAIIDDRPGLLLIVEKQPWGNTLEITHAVEAALEALRPGLPGVEVDSTIFRPASFIERALANLQRALLVGCALVVAVLIAFLLDWRMALISAVAIPLSLLAALVALALIGATVNTMVVAGLVVAVGEVVDDAIIDVENISRRLRLNREARPPRPALRVVLDASLEVRSAVVFATLVIVLVFLPVFFLEGIAGAFFRPLALAYVLAIGASLLIALTVTPAMCLLLLPRSPRRPREALLVRASKAVYRRVLPRVTARPRAVVAVYAVALAASAAAASELGEELLPDFRETDFLMHWVEKPGTSIDAMQRITARVSRELRAIPGVRNFGSHIGRAEAADEVVGPNFTELWISIDPDADYAPTVARIRDVVAGYPGLYRDVLTYLDERIKEVVSGASATIVVRLYGPELEGLRTHAAACAEAIADVPGVADLQVEPQVLVPEVEIRLRPGAAARFGLRADDVRQAVTTLVRQKKVGEIYRGDETCDVVVWGVPAVRADVGALSRLPIDAPGGAQVPLRDVADVAVVGVPSDIRREGASRRLDITCNARGRDLGSVAAAVEERVRGVALSRGYRAEVLGAHAAHDRARRRLLELAALALLGIVLLLHADFQSLRLTLLVVLSLPFALIGGVIGAWAGGGVLSLGSLIGFVTVLGIAARNGIMLVSHYRHLEEREGMPFGPALVLRGAEERLAPISMTALTAALALLPLALAGDRPGHEIEHPMALVILGGLTTSTLLNLLFLPALYGAVATRARRRA